MPSATQRMLRIAVIGTGPGGLSAAIALSELPNVHLTVFERAGELKEMGTGISINHNGWRVLELLAARDGVTGASTVPTVQRNAYTGEIVDQGTSPDPSDRYEARRVRRKRLQRALARRVPEGIIEFDKKLVSLENLEGDGVRLGFADGSQTKADLVVGSDGIRSVVRKHLNPDYDLRYAGQVGWRVLLPIHSVSHVRDFPFTTTSWWRGAGKSLYISPVDNQGEEIGEECLEFTCRSLNEPEVEGKTVPWGVPASNERVYGKFKDCDPRLVEIFKTVPEGSWMEFASYAGPAMRSLTGWDKVVLIGDASHPSAGGFGSGSAFAMEDSWILARAIEHSRLSTGALAEALRIFDSIRAPYYQAMFDYRQSQKENIKRMAKTDWKDFNRSLRERMASDGLGARRGKGFLDWVYSSDIGKTWHHFLESYRP